MIGETNPTIDAGLWRPASLGDYVWHDINHNGVQEANEPAIAGVIVTLRTPTTTLQTTTNANGAYMFTNLISGAPYTVTFATPPGFEPTVTSGAASDPNNSDPNADGQVVVTLAPGEDNPNIDAGFWQPAQLGDYVWLDVDRDGEQDAGEPPVAGVVVTLQTPAGVLTATTSLTGYYQFVGLTPGVPYTVSFGLPGGGYTWTVQTGDVNNPANSDARPDGVVPAVTLTPGGNNPNVDAGLWITPDIDVLKTSMNPGATRPGGTIRYQITVRNNGPTLSRNVVLTDPIPADTSYIAGSAAPVAQLIANKLEWRLGDLAPGQAVSVTFSVKVDDNVSVTTIRNTALVKTDETTVELLSNEVQNPTSPTAVTLDRFEAKLQTVVGQPALSLAKGPSSVVVQWATALELNTLGFDLYRSETATRGDAVKVNATMIAAKGASGGAYELVDAAGTAQSRYWLVETELSGATHEYGPVAVASSAQPPVTSSTNSSQVAAARVLVDAAPVGGLVANNAPVTEAAQAQRVAAAKVEPIVVGQAAGAIVQGGASPLTSDAASIARAPEAVVVAPAVVAAVAPPVAAGEPVRTAPEQPKAQPVTDAPQVNAPAVSQAVVGQPARSTSATRPTIGAPVLGLVLIGMAGIMLFGAVLLVGVGVVLRRRRQ
jgi:uncharacterized repeat protein (TIGR01451 family)